MCKTKNKWSTNLKMTERVLHNEHHQSELPWHSGQYFVLTVFANIRSRCFHWPECSVPLKCPRQGISCSSVCALTIPKWWRLCVCFQRYVNSLQSLHHSPMFMFSNVFRLKSASCLLYPQVNPRMKPESIHGYLNNAFLPSVWEIDEKQMASPYLHVSM